MTKHLFILLFLFCTICCIQAQEIATDSQATPETKALYQYLLETQKSGHILLGHHDALAYGHGWRDTPGKSDVKEMTGSHPAVCSMDFGKIEHNAEKNINGIPFDKMRELIRYAYQRGQTIMMCWHVDNPKTYAPGSPYPQGTSWDNSDNTVVREIIQEGSPLNATFKTWLDRLAAYILSLTDEQGKTIPFIFRPWHEHTQSWNWWGSKCATDEEFRALWEFTLRYLRDEKGIHQMIYAISPQMDEVYPDTQKRLTYRWPGDKLVDFIGMDCYHGRNKKAFASNVKAIAELSVQKQKPCGITETGIEGVNYPTYFTEEVRPALENNPVSLIVFWRNDSRSKPHHFLPYKGHPAEADFVRFTQWPVILLEKDLQTGISQ